MLATKFGLDTLERRPEEVDLAAVVTVPSLEDFAALPASQPHASSRSVNSLLMPILGNDVLRGWMERIRKLGVPSLWLASSSREENTCSALGALASQGIRRFLMIKLKSYAEMDLADLLEFHRESRNTVTEVHDSRGYLGVRVLDHPAQTSDGKSCDYCVPGESERPFYSFRGYAKRILSAKERQDLVGDALTGTCAMRPLGKEIRQQLWIGEGASLANSVRIIGPSYIGARAIIRAGATIGPFASVERDCVVDCGTTVERSTVLPRTYLAPGLLIRNALVDGRYLEDLQSGIVADLKPAGLARSVSQHGQGKQRFSETTSEIFWSEEDRPWGSACPSAWRKVSL
jgi:carbonic anhydrase/acetyltransferase-like protein (isoleucine patch superfamily)